MSVIIDSKNFVFSENRSNAYFFVGIGLGFYCSEDFYFSETRILVNNDKSKNEERAVTSCFRSKTERELNAARKNNIVPGPGTYDLKLEVNARIGVSPNINSTFHVRI